MWLRLSNGRIEKIINEGHIRQRKAEGAVEVPDPTLPEVIEEVSEQVDASTANDGTTEQPGQNDDSRPIRRKSAVQRPTNSGQA